MTFEGEVRELLTSRGSLASGRARDVLAEHIAERVLEIAKTRARSKWPHLWYAEAEDLAVATWVKANQNLRAFAAWVTANQDPDSRDTGRSFEKWIRMIVDSVAIDTRRREVSRCHESLDELDGRSRDFSDSSAGAAAIERRVLLAEVERIADGISLDTEEGIVIRHMLMECQLGLDPSISGSCKQLTWTEGQAKARFRRVAPALRAWFEVVAPRAWHAKAKSRPRRRVRTSPREASRSGPPATPSGSLRRPEIRLLWGR